jgi:hypothetical protein
MISGRREMIDAEERPFYCRNGVLALAVKVPWETLRNKNPSPVFP